MYDNFEICDMPLSLKSNRTRVERFLADSGLRLEDVDYYAVATDDDGNIVLDGINMTKEGFAKGVGKVLPLVGAPISATITYYTFRPMARRLKKHLDELYDMRH